MLLAPPPTPRAPPAPLPPHTAPTAAASRAPTPPATTPPARRPPPPRPTPRPRTPPAPTTRRTTPRTTPSPPASVRARHRRRPRAQRPRRRSTASVAPARATARRRGGARCGTRGHPTQPRPRPSSARDSTRTGSSGAASSSARRAHSTTSPPRSRPAPCSANRCAISAATSGPARSRSVQAACSRPCASAARPCTSATYPFVTSRIGPSAAGPHQVPGRRAGGGTRVAQEADRAQQPLLALPPVRAEPSGLQQRPRRLAPLPGRPRAVGEALQLVREGVVRRLGRRRTVMQGRPLVVDEQRRLPVQPEPPHRRQLPVHRRPHEGIGERQAPGGRARGRVEQSGGARLLHLAERPVHVGQGGGGGHRDTVTDHGGGLDEAPRAVAAGREPAADHPAEHPGSGQHGFPTLPAVGRCLHQQREHVAGIAEGVGAQAVRHQPRDGRPGRGGGQRLDVGRRQRTDLDGDAGVSLGEPPEPGRQAGLVRRHHQDRQHGIRRQPAHREQQRSKRVHVRPVRIVDHDHHRSRDAAPDQRGEDQAAHHDRFLDRQHPLDVRQERASPSPTAPKSWSTRA